MSFYKIPSVLDVKGYLSIVIFIFNPTGCLSINLIKIVDLLTSHEKKLSRDYVVKGKKIGRRSSIDFKHLTECLLQLQFRNLNQIINITSLVSAELQCHATVMIFFRSHD